MISLIIGIISGIVSAMGMGGGAILILCLSMFLGKEQHIAQGTNLVFFIPTAIVSIFINLKKKLIKWKSGLVIAGFGVVGSIIRSKYRYEIKYFGIFLLIIAMIETFTFFKKKS